MFSISKYVPSNLPNAWKYEDSFIYPFILSNHFRLDRTIANLDPVPEILSVRWAYTLIGITVRIIHT